MRCGRGVRIMKSLDNLEWALICLLRCCHGSGLAQALEEQHYWLGFSLLRDIGPKRILHLRHHFGTLKQAWQAPKAALAEAGLSESLAGQTVQQRAKIDLQHELRRVHHVRAFLRTLPEPDYPPLLKDLEDAPPVLYLRGSLATEDARAVCIVGTRRATVYGKDVAYQLAYDLASNGVTVVSGLAHGVDTAAHTGALDAGGRTLAVTACGISEIYPADNLPLAHRIIEQGAVLTEFPLGTPPSGKNFPRRNRILSGLSLGVLVVEAGEKSGALITAGLAAEQGRDVFAVPSNIFNMAGRGANRLIQDGAKLVMGVEDVLAELEIAHEFAETRTQTQAAVPENDDEGKLLALLGPDALHVDDLVRLSGLPTATVTSTLTILELKGLARNIGQMQYILSR